MSTQDNKIIARRVYAGFEDLFRSGDTTALQAVVDANFVDHNPGSGQGPGLEGLRSAFEAYRAAFSDTEFRVEDLVAEGDKVVARVVSRSTHTGDFQGIPATGKRVTVEVIDILRIVGDKVVERWGILDSLSLLQQIGAVPPPPGR